MKYKLWEVQKRVDWIYELVIIRRVILGMTWAFERGHRSRINLHFILHTPPALRLVQLPFLRLGVLARKLGFVTDDSRSAV